jgi:hypothetical protein
MLQKSPREERFGCLFGLAGAVIGFLIGSRMHTAAVEASRRAHPDDPIDFLPAMPFAGLVAGFFAFALVGMILSRLLPAGKPDA